MEKIREYDRKRNRRLIILVPVAVVVIIVLLTAFERTRIVDRFFSVGYEGPMKLLPEITIIDDRGLEAEVFSEDRHDMKVREVELFSDEEEEIDEEDPEISTAPEREIEETDFDEEISTEYVRTYPSHTSVPYREDYVILNMVQPEYPADAMERRMEGYVLVEVYIDESGHVSEAWVRKVYGIKSFEKSSLDAVRQFVFKPVMENGEPQSFWVSFLISFRLNR